MNSVNYCKIKISTALEKNDFKAVIDWAKAAEKECKKEDDRKHKLVLACMIM